MKYFLWIYLTETFDSFLSNKNSIGGYFGEGKPSANLSGPVGAGLKGYKNFERSGDCKPLRIFVLERFSLLMIQNVFNIRYTSSQSRDFPKM